MSGIIEKALGARPRPWILRYGLAFVSVGTALLFTVVMYNAGIRGPLFIPAVLVSAWFGGLGPGLLAAALATLSVDFFLTEPRYSFWLASVGDAVYLVTFAASAGFVAWVAGRQQSTMLALRAAHAHLTARTHDLGVANTRLETEVLERRRVDSASLEQASLLDLTHDTIFVRDAHDVITYWNRGAESLYGWSRAEAIGQVSHRLMQTVFPAPLDEIEAELHRTGRWEGELIHTKRDDTQVVVASRWSLQRDQQGSPAGVLETNNNITERIRSAEALQEAQAELARVTRITMLGEITASIAHEVNQPLAAIVMNGNACRRWLAADPPDLAEARDAVQRVVDNGNRASEVVRRIRSLLQGRPPEKAPLDVNEVVRDTLALTQTELARRRVAVRTELHEPLPSTVADRTGLEQVLVNLILNGADAMAGENVAARTLTIRSRADPVAGIAVEVRDSGKGIDPGHSDRIFAPFFSTKPTGLGMGLAISRSIVEAHGGQIWAAPNDGAPGATLHFTIPAAGLAGSAASSTEREGSSYERTLAPRSDYSQGEPTAELGA